MSKEGFFLVVFLFYTSSYNNFRIFGEKSFYFDGNNLIFDFLTINDIMNYNFQGIIEKKVK